MKKLLLLSTIIIPVIALVPASVGATPTFPTDFYTRAQQVANDNDVSINWSDSSTNTATLYDGQTYYVFQSTAPLKAKLSFNDGSQGIGYSSTSSYDVKIVGIDYTDHANDYAETQTGISGDYLLSQTGFSGYYSALTIDSGFSLPYTLGYPDNQGDFFQTTSSHSIFPTGVASDFINKVKNAMSDNLTPILIVGGFIIGLSIIMTMLDIRRDRKYLDNYKKTWGMK